MGIKHLCLIFGVAPSCHKWCGQHNSLVGCQEAASFSQGYVSYNAKKMALFAQLNKAWEPMVDYVIGVLDGLSLASEDFSQRVTLSAADWSAGAQ
jgi:hypothetical protein